MTIPPLRWFSLFKKAVVTGCLFYMPLQSMAWGMTGHRIVGEIASFYISAKAKKNIQAILGTESIAMASNWADFIRSDSSYQYLNTWHYINLNGGLTTQEINSYLQHDNQTDAYTRIHFLVSELKNKTLAPEKKLLYLRLLIHLTGDLSQPMHTSHSEDQGGNRINVLWFDKPSNLHRVWDEQLVEYQQLSYTEYVKAINFPTKEQADTWKKQPVNGWISDSYQISEQLYAEIKQPDQKLGYRYNFDHIKTVNEQLLKGGIRLAGILDQIFG